MGLIYHKTSVFGKIWKAFSVRNFTLQIMDYADLHRIKTRDDLCNYYKLLGFTGNTSAVHKAFPICTSCIVTSQTNETSRLQSELPTNCPTV